MIRAFVSCACVGLFLFATGCQKSTPEPQGAVVAKAGLMPVGDGRAEALYVADQKQVKMIERTVSYEPLDTYITQNAAAEEAKKATLAKEQKAEQGDEGKVAKEDVKADVKEAGAKKAVAKTGKSSGKGGLISKMKKKLAGGLPSLGQGVGTGMKGKPSEAKGSEKKAEKGGKGEKGAEVKKKDSENDEEEATDEGDEEESDKGDAEEEDNGGDEDSSDEEGKDDNGGDD